MYSYQCGSETKYLISHSVLGMYGCMRDPVYDLTGILCHLFNEGLYDILEEDVRQQRRH